MMTANIALGLIENKIRLGQEPNNPTLLDSYVRQAERHARQLKPEDQFVFFIDIFNCLIDTMSDTHLPYHWRCLCLDYLPRPLNGIERAAVTQEEVDFVRDCYCELRSLSFYFLSNDSPLATSARDNNRNNQLIQGGTI